MLQFCAALAVELRPMAAFAAGYIDKKIGICSEKCRFFGTNLSF
jgi:hypothetical protein